MTNVNRWARAATLLLCAAVTVPPAMDLLGMEFGGGQLTGFLVRMALVGCAIFAIDIVATFFAGAMAILLAVLAAILCIPFDLYRIAPQTLSWLSTAPSSVVPGAAVTFDPWAVGSLAAIALMAAVHALSARPRVAPGDDGAAPRT